MKYGMREGHIDKERYIWIHAKRIVIIAIYVDKYIYSTSYTCEFDVSMQSGLTHVKYRNPRSYACVEK